MTNPNPAPPSLPKDGAEPAGECASPSPAGGNFDEEIGALVSDLQAHEDAAREAKDAAADCKARIKELLEGAGVLKTKARFGNRAWTVTLKSGPTRPDWDDDGALPPQYTKLEPKVDRKALAKALKSGEAIPGARLVKGDATLQITGELE